jgi:hypothetical protein
LANDVRTMTMFLNAIDKAFGVLAILLTVTGGAISGMRVDWLISFWAAASVLVVAGEVLVILRRRTHPKVAIDRD